jgi:ribose-phosphate pyrophosphokinase
MILFSTNATRHLASRIALQPGMCTIKQFNDGELFVRIDEDVQGKQVWVLAATQAPAHHLLELFFLLDALQRAGAHINLFITYFAYARQIIAAPGEACSACVITTFLKNFILIKTYILHPHSILLHDYLPFTAIRDMDFFCEQAAAYDAVAAPDKGAYALAKEIAEFCNKELIELTKMRPDHDTVEIVAINGSVEHKKVLLVDDIISTGRTLAQAASALKKLGAHSIAAAATHGVFSPGSHQLLEQSVLEKISVTNTIAQHSHGKITIIDISPLIQKIMLTSD